MMVSKQALAACSIALMMVFSNSARSMTITGHDADFDRWMYPFNQTPGIRGTASTFFDGQTPTGFDNRDGQLLVGFNTLTAGVPTGLPLNNYQIVSASVEATHFTGTFDYDPTYDSYESYDGTTTDTDTGRPIELYAAGFRNFAFGQLFPGAADTPPGYLETDSFAFASPTLPGVRNSFADDLVNGDVSNNVDGGFEANPLGIGLSTSGLSAGDPVPEGVAGISAGETFNFGVDLGRSEVVTYLQQGLAGGGLFFTVSSLHSATQNGGTSPNFYTSPNFDPAAIPSQLNLEVDIVPEPNTATALLMGVLCCCGLVRSRRGRDHVRT